MPLASSDWKYLKAERLHIFEDTRKNTFFPLMITFFIHPVTIRSWLTTSITTNMFLAYSVFLTVTELQTMSDASTKLEDSTVSPDLASSGIWIVSVGISPVWRTLARRSWLLLAEKQGKVCYDRVMFQYFHLHIQGIGLIMMRNKILWTLAYEIYGKQISTIIIMKRVSFVKAYLLSEPRF